MAGVFRTERSYRVTPEHAARLERAVAARLGRRAPVGGIEGWARTVYLDTEDGAFTREILENPLCSTKLRVRRYGPDAPGADPRAWVEVKHRRGLVVAKVRFEAPCAALPALLRGDVAPATDDERELARVRAARRLVPTVVVDYR